MSDGPEVPPPRPREDAEKPAVRPGADQVKSKREAHEKRHPVESVGHDVAMLHAITKISGDPLVANSVAPQSNAVLNKEACDSLCALLDIPANWVTIKANRLDNRSVLWTVETPEQLGALASWNFTKDDDITNLQVDSHALYRAWRPTELNTLINSARPAERRLLVILKNSHPLPRVQMAESSLGGGYCKVILKDETTGDILYVLDVDRHQRIFRMRLPGIPDRPNDTTYNIAARQATEGSLHNTEKTKLIQALAPQSNLSNDNIIVTATKSGGVITVVLVDKTTEKRILEAEFISKEEQPRVEIDRLGRYGK